MEFLALLILLVIYFLPTIIAWRRRKVSLVLFGLWNFLFGWTVIGWFILLIKSLSTSIQDQLNSGISVRGLSDVKR
jgi:hypothetical protein